MQKQRLKKTFEFAISPCVNCICDHWVFCSCHRDHEVQTYSSILTMATSVQSSWYFKGCYCHSLHYESVSLSLFTRAVGVVAAAVAARKTWWSWLMITLIALYWRVMTCGWWSSLPPGVAIAKGKCEWESEPNVFKLQVAVTTPTRNLDHVTFYSPLQVSAFLGYKTAAIKHLL